jgi:hypothetical protein
MSTHPPTRRDVLRGAAAVAAAPQAVRAAAPEPAKVYRIGVISAAIRGKPQPRNGHTWHFAQYLHPECNLDAVQKYLDPGSVEFFRKYVRNPRYTFDALPFPDTRITHYYDADPSVIGPFPEAFPGVRAARAPKLRPRRSGTGSRLILAVQAAWRSAKKSARLSPPSPY